MNQINFLPESFGRTHRRMRRRPKEFAAIILTVLVLVLVWLYAGGPNTTLAQQANDLKQAIDRVEQLQSEEDRLTQERERLRAQLLIARETHQPITMTQILARLSQHAPDPIRLVQLEATAQRADPEPMPDTSAKAKKRVIASKKNKAGPPPRQPNVMRLALTGFAPTDEELVTLIRRLGQDPVFTSVALRGSRVASTKTHLVREFKLDLTIDLDRRFVPASGAGGDHAD